MIYDITPPIGPDLVVWPGDNAPEREVLLDMARGDNITLSTLRATVHLGAHADAPSHYGKDAPTIDERPLERYVGPCRVVRVRIGRGEPIPVAAIPPNLDEPRLLFATGTFPDPTRFNEDFASLTPELVHELDRRGVQLVGIDTPSVDAFSSKELPSHRAILERDMAILEGLVLDCVPEGVYELIALPLALVGFDGSPVRAILRD